MARGPASIWTLTPRKASNAARLTLNSLPTYLPCPLAYPHGSRDPDTIAQTVAEIVWMRRAGCVFESVKGIPVLGLVSGSLFESEEEEEEEEE